MEGQGFSKVDVIPHRKSRQRVIALSAASLSTGPGPRPGQPISVPASCGFCLVRPLHPAAAAWCGLPRARYGCGLLRARDGSCLLQARYGSDLLQARDGSGLLQAREQPRQREQRSAHPRPVSSNRCPHCSTGFSDCSTGCPNCSNRRPTYATGARRTLWDAGADGRPGLATERNRQSGAGHSPR